MQKLTFGQRAVCLGSTIIFLLVSLDCFGRSKPLMLVGVLSLFLSLLSVFILLSDPEYSLKIERFFKKDKPERKTGSSTASTSGSALLSAADIKALYAVKPDPEEIQDYMIKVHVSGMTPREALEKLLQERKSG